MRKLKEQLRVARAGRAPSGSIHWNLMLLRINYFPDGLNKPVR
jgi:hypothetical protein